MAFSACGFLAFLTFSTILTLFTSGFAGVSWGELILSMPPSSPWISSALFVSWFLWILWMRFLSAFKVIPCPNSAANSAYGMLRPAPGGGVAEHIKSRYPLDGPNSLW
ncbi:hypothetical protein L211DRAFT_703474 [Terfezia boudieri ATCC MYA-4762]|uniref:Uncharacterized protein n=1 Tax=Terfezia boudieri ATCC MYA-4762 TaxID=1051890 RepID=A0A3N4LTM1_9PEZI|nr:hypothetical protein L211DRAFT_703474 [Terfezia boudieri ATCC MYA-4762]